MRIWYIILCFFLYGFLGWCAEVTFAAVRHRKFVNRGFLNGPICPIYGVGIVLVVMLLEPFRDNVILLYLLSAALVTFLEWITGFVMEKLFHHKWWDYSNMPFNLGGYVCLPFSFLWGFACLAIVYFVHPPAYHILSLLPVWLAAGLGIFLGILLASDLAVTVVSVFKLNGKLEKMEEITEELHRLSEQVGSGIYKNVMEEMEKQELRKQKSEELRKKYRELAEDNSRIRRRLVKAFPTMKSSRHDREFSKMKEQIEKGGNRK